MGNDEKELVAQMRRAAANPESGSFGTLLTSGASTIERLSAIEQERDALREALRDLYGAFLSKHGCFPLDRVTPEQRQWNGAMTKAQAVLLK